MILCKIPKFDALKFSSKWLEMRLSVYFIIKRRYNKEDTNNLCYLKKKKKRFTYKIYDN